MAGSKTVQPVHQESVSRFNKRKFSFFGSILIYLNTKRISAGQISVMRDFAGIGSAPRVSLKAKMYRKIGTYIIRDWQIKDAPFLAKFANNKMIWQNLRDAFPHPYELQDAKSFILRVKELNPKTMFAIATQKEAIGSIGLTLGKDVHRRTAEIAYMLAEPYWGIGIMTQAVKSLTEYAINDLNMLRVFAEPYTTNHASARVLEKAGFIREGILRSNALKNGKVLDQFIYSYIACTGTRPDAPPNPKGPHGPWD